MLGHTPTRRQPLITPTEDRPVVYVEMDTRDGDHTKLVPVRGSSVCSVAPPPPPVRERYHREEWDVDPVVRRVRNACLCGLLGAACLVFVVHILLLAFRCHRTGSAEIGLQVETWDTVCLPKQQSGTKLDLRPTTQCGRAQAATEPYALSHYVLECFESGFLGGIVNMGGDTEFRALVVRTAHSILDHLWLILVIVAFCIIAPLWASAQQLRAIELIRATQNDGLLGAKAR